MTNPAGDSESATDWREKLEATGELTSEIVEMILDQHGDRGRRAIDAVGERRVKEYRDFTIVVGHTEEYVIEDGSCTCKDSRYNLDPENPAEQCWHVLAVAIARRIGTVEHHDMWYSEVRDFL